MKQKTLIYMVIKPSIVRVGCSAFLVLAAAVLTAASLLSPFARAQVEGCDSPSPRTVPVKIVKIKNNSGVPIYVVLETAKQDILDENKRPHDRWLQAEFQPTKGTYASTYLYRAYVNPQNGIAKDGESVSVTLPFYTQLESKPCPNKPDQYINWWRALRIYVYDDPGAIKQRVQHGHEPGQRGSNFQVRAQCGACADMSRVFRAARRLSDPDRRRQARRVAAGRRSVAIVGVHVRHRHAVSPAAQDRLRVRRLRYFVGRSGVPVRRHGSREQPVHRIHRLGAAARHIQRQADEFSERFRLAEVQVAGLRHEQDRHPAARHVQRHERDRAPRRSATIRAGRCRDQKPSRRPEDGEAMGRMLR